MFCSHCSTKNPDDSVYCFNCGQKMLTTKSGPPPLSNDALTGARTRALAKVLVARGANLATEADVESVTQEIQQDAARDRNKREAAPSAPMHLHFFTAVDRDGVTRFFDIMQQEGGFSVAETATSAPRLSPSPCSESVYETRDHAAIHHVHRLYGDYSTAQAGQAHLAMQLFAKCFGLTQVIRIAEALDQLGAKPTWDVIFQKLGCPPGRLSFKSRSSFSE